MTQNKFQTAIITWISYPNYGSMLQAYALQQTLKRLGVDSKLIDDSRYVRPKGFKCRIKNFVCSLLKAFLFQRRKSFSSFAYFKQNFLQVDAEWKNTSQLSDRYSRIICGSDQIWSSILPDHHNGFYFASFASEECEKIAYAPSIGSMTYSTEYAELVRPWIKNFKSLSSREKSGADILKEISARDDVAVVLDPTLLLSSEQWRELEKHSDYPLPDGHYMFAYFLTFNETYLRFAKGKAAEMGLQLVTIDNLPMFGRYADRVLSDVGPVAFLRLIANADYVVTDSFHGSIFSIQYRKPFITVKRFSDNEPRCQNSRIYNLFELLGIRDNFLSGQELDRQPCVPDWNSVERALDTERQMSIDYLRKALA